MNKKKKILKEKPRDKSNSWWAWWRNVICWRALFGWVKLSVWSETNTTQWERRLDERERERENITDTSHRAYNSQPHRHHISLFVSIIWLKSDHQREFSQDNSITRYAPVLSIGDEIIVTQPKCYHFPLMFLVSNSIVCLQKFVFVFHLWIGIFFVWRLFDLETTFVN